MAYDGGRKYRIRKEILSSAAIKIYCEYVYSILINFIYEFTNAKHHENKKIKREQKKKKLKSEQKNTHEHATHTE